MADIWGFFGEILASGLISAALLSIAAILGRGQLTHLLNKDLERIKADHQKDMEGIKADYQKVMEGVKADHQKDLENYKVSLIADAERARAEQNVKTSVALKFSENQFTALEKINSAYADLGQKAMLLHHMPDQFFSDIRFAANKGLILDFEKELKKEHDIFSEASDRLTKSIFSGMLFLKEEDVKLLQNYDALLCGVVQLGLDNFIKYCGHQNEVQPSNEDVAEFALLKNFEERKEFVRGRENEVSKVIRSYAEKFLRM